MKLEEWRLLLEDCGLSEEWRTVWESLTKGFDQGVPQHKIDGLRWFTPDNHRSAFAVCNKIMKNLFKKRKLGRIFGPFSHEEVFKRWGFFRSNPMGSVVNNDGSLCMINDLSYQLRVPGRV